MFSDEIGEELVVVNKFDITDPVVGQTVKEVTLMFYFLSHFLCLVYKLLYP